MTTTSNTSPLLIGCKVRKTTGLATFGLIGTVTGFRPYAKGTLAIVQRAAIAEPLEADMREFEVIS